MCDTNGEMEISKQIFLKANTVMEFMNVWSKFYENKICIPTYFSKFVGAEDNPEATAGLGRKLKEIAQRGILAIDSQVGVPGNQKQYITGFLPTKLAEIIIPEINRYSSIVGFYGPIIDTETTSGLYVTYDALPEDIEKGAAKKKMLGDPFSSIRGADVDSFETIREWMSPSVRAKINKKRYSHFLIMSPCFGADPEYIFDALLEVLRRV